MAASSSSSAAPQVKYDVFLSFRGDDTRYGFTSHLYAALCRKNIQTLMDNQLIRGDEISSSLLNKIEASKISIIIFSENYADSKWCVGELKHILECKRMYGQIVIPVFFHVDPSHVRHQSGAFGAAFAKLGERFTERVDEWKAAFEEAANLCGSHLNDRTPETELIDAIVGDILNRLNKLSPIDNEDLIGAELSIQKIESLMHIGLNGVCIIGIWGIGGIGKTTIARAVFKKTLRQFEAYYFAESIREQAEKSSGLIDLRQKLLSVILDDRHSNIELSFTKERLGRKKVLIVFDDVICFQQIQKLIGDLNILGVGSQIIITTRNKQVLQNCGVDDAKIYELKGLCFDDALQLYSKYAFKENYPFEGYMELSKKIIMYAKGVPLALKILGSYLLNKTKQEYESAIEKLDKSPHQGIQEVLKISYDGLDDVDRNIFLDIACFFKGWKRDLIKDILDASGFYTEIGLRYLIDMSLVTISGDKIIMHDLLQQMGREIVKQESVDEPGKRSRLWHHEDIYRVFKRNTGTEAIQGICLDISKIQDITLNPCAFAKLPNLRIFEVYNSNYKESDNKFHGFEALESFPTEPICFGWHGYPFKTLPFNFHAENLVRLDMPHSKVRRLWNGVQHLVKLKKINLAHSKCLKRIPNLSKAINLRELILEGCTRLFKITSASVQNLQKLVILNLKDCQSLISLPAGIQSEYLTDVILSGCANLKRAPKIPCSVERLYLDNTAIKKFPLIEYPSRLATLDLQHCRWLESLPDNFCQLKCLQYLYISGCSKLERLPDDLGSLEALVELESSATAIREVPSSIIHLKNLFILSLHGSNGLTSVGLVLPPLSGLSFLTELSLSYCNITKLPENLGDLSSLQCLWLRGNKFESIPEIKYLYNLETLDLCHCENLQLIPELPWVQRIEAHSCSSLVSISSLILLPSISVVRVNLTNCFQLDQKELEDRIEDCFLRLHDKMLYQRTRAIICFPGNDIPKWFSFQSTGSEFPLKLQRGWFNKSFLGFAICVVVAFQDYLACDRDYFIVRCICTTKRRESEKEKLIGILRMRWWECDPDVLVASDHVFLGYDFEMQEPINVWDPLDYHYVDLNFNNEASFEFFFEVKDVNGQRIDAFEVKRCGVQLLYAQDCGKAMEGTSTSSNSVEVVGVEEEAEPDCEELMEGTGRGFNSVEVVEEEEEEPPACVEPMELEGTSRSFNFIGAEVQQAEEEPPAYVEPMELEGTSRSFNFVETGVEAAEEEEEPHPKRLKYFEFF